jgi:hypothetical protein
MIYTRSLYESCDELFAAYPLAVRAGDGGTTTICSMVLTLRNGDDAGFFVLSYDDGGRGKPSYLLRSWSEGAVVDITDDGVVASDVIVDAITQGVPIPVHGSVFGWRCGDAVTALILTYANWTPGAPEPSWAVMPLVGISQQQWPPFTGERLFDRWFWDCYLDGSIVSLSELIAGTRDAVFWVDTKAILGSGCCAVTRDIKSSKGYTLSAGRYVYHEVLRAGQPVPSLELLLASASTIDLAPRLRPAEAAAN